MPIPNPTSNTCWAPPTHPWGLAEVDAISQTDQLDFSLDSLLNTILPVDQIQKQFGRLRLGAVAQPGDHSRHICAAFRLSLRLTVTGQAPLSVEQISLVNTATTKTWVLLMGCSPACFAQHRGQIDRVVNSWIVKAGQS